MDIKTLPEVYIELEDTEWPYEYTDHDRLIARAIVFDDEGWLYFVKASRDDDFGKAVFIETSGGGVELHEDLESAVIRELNEELGAEAAVKCKIGTVSDYYNLIHRHNINHYYLCKVSSFGERHLMPDEVNDFHLSVMKLRYGDALHEYENNRTTRIGRLITNREINILKRAGIMLGFEEGSEWKDHF